MKNYVGQLSDVIFSFFTELFRNFVVYKGVKRVGDDLKCHISQILTVNC